MHTGCAPTLYYCMYVHEHALYYCSCMHALSPDATMKCGMPTLDLRSFFKKSRPGRINSHCMKGLRNFHWFIDSASESSHSERSGEPSSASTPKPLSATVASSPGSSLASSGILLEPNTASFAPRSADASELNDTSNFILQPLWDMWRVGWPIKCSQVCLDVSACASTLYSSTYILSWLSPKV